MRPMMRRPAPDPAPSRLTYRAQRLWLTPIFRKTLRVGLPAFTVMMVAGSFLADPVTQQRMRDAIGEIRREIEDRPEFRVNVLGITGASPQVTEDVRAALALDLPLSSFDFDLDDLRARVEALPAVRTADLRIQTGGYLAVTVDERVPAFIWQTRDGPVLIDADGHFVASLDSRPQIPALPLIGGDGADRATAEAAQLIAAAAPLGARLRGLVRMGERRWDVVLVDDRRILLPETDAVAALDRALALDDATELLTRDVVRVDLRNPDRLTVQMTPAAIGAYRDLRAREMSTESGGQSG